MTTHAVARASDGNFQMIRPRPLEQSGQLRLGGLRVGGDFPDFGHTRFVQPARVVGHPDWWCNPFIPVIPNRPGDVPGGMRD